MYNTLKARREYKTPMVWNVVVSCDMTFDADNDCEAYDFASELGNKMEILKTLLSDREKFGVDISIDFDDDCLCEMKEVC